MRVLEDKAERKFEIVIEMSKIETLDTMYTRLANTELVVTGSRFSDLLRPVTELFTEANKIIEVCRHKRLNNIASYHTAKDALRAHVARVDTVLQKRFCDEVRVVLDTFGPPDKVAELSIAFSTTLPDAINRLTKLHSFFASLVLDGISLTGDSNIFVTQRIPQAKALLDAFLHGFESCKIIGTTRDANPEFVKLQSEFGEFAVFLCRCFKGEQYEDYTGREYRAGDPS